MNGAVPSENEWFIMEAVWKSQEPMTAAEIIRELADVLDISAKTIRVMLNRLLAKGVLGYTVDPHDARVYHYFPLKTKEECLNSKSERFVNHYFGGNASLAVASFLRSARISKEQLAELESLVEELKEQEE